MAAGLLGKLNVLSKSGETQQDSWHA